MVWTSKEETGFDFEGCKLHKTYITYMDLKTV